MGYLAKRKLEYRERITLYVLLMIIPALTLLGTVGGGMDWRLNFIGEFKIQAAVLSFLLCLFCIYKRLAAVAGCFFLFALMNLALAASHYHFSEQESVLPEDAPQFTFFYQDLEGADKKSEEIGALLDALDTDVVLLSNVPVSVYERLNDIKNAYVLQNQTTDTTGRMMLILGRMPATARGVLNGNDAAWISHVIGERKLTVVLTDLKDVRDDDAYEEALNKMQTVSEFVRDRDEPVLLIGNLRVSDFSRLTRDLKDVGKLALKEPLALGYPATWLSVLRRPVASVYAHPGIEVLNIYAVTNLGLRSSGVTATVKMAPVKKEVVFYDLQPIVPEDALLHKAPAAK